ncbi:MAG: type IV pilus twitching motility protein PilT [Oscillospiraceae bacterium]|nr:type IV pilus twitching motility protein PilT [Oscillospiraceae bacterium]
MLFSDKVSNYPVTLEDLLRLTVEKKGSDLHIVSGIEPCIRINGDLCRQTDLPRLGAEDVEQLLLQVISDSQRRQLEEEWELDLAVSVPQCARFRGNVIIQRGTIAAVFRAIPFSIPELDKLGLPNDVRRLCNLPRGLVLVTGPTGSGKSTTLAAMINYINENYETNIVTVEDPIEFLHVHKKSTVRQREIGTDTKSFANALKTVLRHDPDTIMIGEMRDPESIQIAVTAAETGHLVLSTLHTQTAPLTISRIIDSFPSDQKSQIRSQLSNSLKAVISQQLIPTINGRGRVAAVEYMVDTPAIKNLIREEKEHQLYATMQTGTMQGMQTMDQALLSLLKQQKISKEAVLEYCVDQKEVLRLMATMGY